MSTDMAVIEAALKAATPGPWEASADNAVPDRAAILTAWCYEGEDGELVTDWCTLPDAHLIANAPTWLAELVERVKVAEAEVKRVREAAHTLGKIIDNQCRDVLDITGAHDLIDADGDGDWGVIWDLLREQAQKGQRVKAAEAAVVAAKADGWDERDRARASYLGPDNGHYEDCMGWEDCNCATYPNPYRALDGDA